MDDWRRRFPVTIRGRLVLSLAAITILLSFPLIVALVTLKFQRDEIARLRDEEFAASVRVGRLRANVEDARITSLFGVGDTAAWTASAAAGRRLSAMSQLLAPYRWLPAAKDFERSATALAQLTQAGLNASIGHDERAALSARQAADRETAKALALLNSLDRDLNRRLEAAVNTGSQRASRALSVGLVAFAAALALVILVAATLTSAISRPVEELKRGFESISEGRVDVVVQTRPNRNDEFGYLAVGFNSMAHRLAALERLRLDWLGLFTHELKTPLVIINGTLEMFSEGLHATLSEKGEELCRRCLTASATLQHRIKNMIEVGKFTGGHATIDPKPILLRGFFADLDATFQVQSAREQSVFELEYDDALPELVEWDEDRVREVFENLVSNAFKFTPREGLVKVRVAPHDQSVSVEVCDTGQGIPPEAIPHLFEHYYQADNQRLANRKGTGLGLAIVKQIVEAHQGQITVASKVGQGTTFAVFLPLVAPGRIPDTRALENN